MEAVLSGTGDRGSVNRTVSTNEKGVFSFPGLQKGTYSLSINVPEGYELTKVKLGKAGGEVSGDTITGIELAKGEKLTGFGFKVAKKS